MSKQLALSAVISTIAMATCALLGTNGASSTYEKGATSDLAAPAFEAATPVR